MKKLFKSYALGGDKSYFLQNYNRNDNNLRQNQLSLFKL